MKLKFILTTVLSLACLLLIYYRPFRVIVVRGNSMYPTLHHGQILIGYKTKDITRNDIVVCNIEGEDAIIKRVKYVGGDSYASLLDFKNTNAILLEGYDTKELLEFKKVYGSLLTITRVPKNHYYVLGDNTFHSDDSRRFGTLTFDEIEYKILGY